MRDKRYHQPKRRDVRKRYRQLKMSKCRAGKRGSLPPEPLAAAA
ncbi:hypothetical protein A225_3659 [Klebsiella michiganensis E718]|nr:hypothetical protein A225_3659 [Klebsiella michiganensis E718]